MLAIFMALLIPAAVIWALFCLLRADSENVPDVVRNRTTSYIGYGSVLGFSTDLILWEYVGQVVDIEPPQEQTGNVQVTNNDSGGGTVYASGRRYHEYLPTLTDGGTASFNLIYTASTYAQLKKIVKGGGQRYWRLRLPDGYTAFWIAHIESLSPHDPMEDRLTIDVTLKVSGEPKFAYGTETGTNFFA